jgi:hypothetical protein
VRRSAKSRDRHLRFGNRDRPTVRLFALARPNVQLADAQQVSRDKAFGATQTHKPRYAQVHIDLREVALTET